MKAKEQDNNGSFALRHAVIFPYVFLPAIFIVITLINIPYMERTHDLTPVWILPFGLLVFVFPIIYMNIRYRIWWRDNAIVMRAGGFAGVIVTMRVEDIERIEQETSNARTATKMNRPFRRIAIYGKTAEGYPYIDVSLKHFNLDDIRKLMRIIHDRCPNLEMPKGWGTTCK